MEKKLQVHSLPTNKHGVGIITYFKKGNRWGINEKQSYLCAFPNDLSTHIPHHLYLTSSDEIKEGDWYMCTLNSLVFPANRIHGQLPTDRKIVATTNPDLVKPFMFPCQLPQSLIEYFVKQQGNVKEVLVKWETLKKFDNFEDMKNYQFGPKLTPSGEIIWKPLEHKMYTINQIFDDILPAFLNEFYPDRKAPRPSKVFDWINKNYPQ